MAVIKCKPLPNVSQKDIDRFWSKVDRQSPDECWPWTAGMRTRGYGQFKAARRNIIAPRLAFFLQRGIDPFPLDICHACDNPPCCNPSHLFAGTQDQNNKDMTAKGRSARGDKSGSRTHPESRPRGDNHPSRLRPECLARGERNGKRTHPEKIQRGDDHHARRRPDRMARGEGHGMVVLTADQVREIRRLHAQGATQAALGKQFGTHCSTIRLIVIGRNWKHLL